MHNFLPIGVNLVSKKAKANNPTTFSVVLIPFSHQCKSNKSRTKNEAHNLPRKLEWSIEKWNFYENLVKCYTT